MNLIETIIDLGASLVIFLIECLPDPEILPEAWNNAFDSWAGWLQSANAMFPVDTLAIQLGIILTLRGGILMFQFGWFGVSFLKGLIGK